MPIIPRYRKQVFTDPNIGIRKPLPKHRRPADIQGLDHDYLDKQAALNAEDINAQSTANIVQTVGNIALSGAALLTNYIEKRAVTKANEAFIGAQVKLRNFYQERERDPDYTSFEESYSKFRDDLYQNQYDLLDNPRAQELFKTNFRQLDFEYEDKVRTLAFQKDVANGAASTQWQYQQLKEMGDMKGIKDLLFGREMVISGGKTIQEAMPGAVASGYISEIEAKILIKEADYSINKNIAIRELNAIAADPKQGHDVAINAVMQMDDEGNYLFQPQLREEDRQSIVSFLNGEQIRVDLAEQRKYAEKDKELSVAFSEYRLYQADINAAVQAKDINDTIAWKWEGRINARADRWQQQEDRKQAEINAAAVAEHAQGVANNASVVRQMIRNNVHKGVVESYINQYVPDDKVADRLYGENDKRSVDPRIDRFMKQWDEIISDHPFSTTLEIERDSFKTWAEARVYDERGNYIADQIIIKQIGERLESELLPYRVEGLMEQFIGEEHEDVTDPKADAAEMNSFEDVTRILTFGESIFWNEHERERFMLIQQQYTDYLVGVYESQRKSLGLEKLAYSGGATAGSVLTSIAGMNTQRAKEKEPIVHYQDGVRPILQTESGRLIGGDFKGNRIVWTPYIPKDQAGVYYDDPFAGRLYYSDNRWWTIAELQETGRIGMKEIIGQAVGPIPAQTTKSEMMKTLDGELIFTKPWGK